jgi:hypothetical protein
MIDHIFMLIDPTGPEIARMETLGLIETYRREHPGQGTQNVCYCFDNMFLELLWVDDPEAVTSPNIKRTGLYERSRWRTTHTCPFGIAWRGTFSSDLQPIPTWAYQAPYLPEGMSIAVAVDGDDPQQPMLFRSPGSAAPIDWPHEKRRDLQRPRGLGAVRDISLTLPSSTQPCEALRIIAAQCRPTIRLEHGQAYRLQMRVEGVDGQPDLTIALPG